MIRNFQNTQQTGAMLPQAFDERGNPLFKLDLLKGGGTKNFDTTKVKEYYKNLILTSLFADVLVMGQSSSGSYALGSIKTTLIGNAIESMLKSIKDVINSDLVRHTYELNGWDASRACSIDYDDLERNDLEGLSKFIQRVASVGLVVKDVETINRIRQAMGVDNVEMTDEELQNVLTPETSRASDGMAKGSGNGTSDAVSSLDSSANNLDNAA
jgi:phage gp29-like protein